MRPIAVERCIGGRELTEPRLVADASAVVYALSVSGVSALMLHPLDGSPVRQLTAYPPPRTGRALGGGCWCFSADGAAVVYAGADGNLWWQPIPGGGVRRLTDLAPDRPAASPDAAPDGLRIVYTVDQAEVWAVSLTDGAVERLDDASADFCLDPAVRPDSTGAVWQAWSVPDMPWDGAYVQAAPFGAGLGTGVGRRAVVVADGAVQQLRFMPDGALLAVRDHTGWNNVWLADTALVDEPFEHAGPTWGAGQRSFTPSPDGARVAFTRNEGGFGRLCVVTVATGEISEVARGVHGHLHWQANSLVAIRTGARTPTQVVVYDTRTWARTSVAIGPVSGWEDESLAEPELVEVTASDGATLFARLYRADAPTHRLLCWLHGGPTDQWQVTFMPRVAYWRSRGWNVLVPDHRGSTGHGRVYQQALVGRWGDLDVTDTTALIAFAHHSGWGDPMHTVVIGGSAGGFTALGVAGAAPQLLAAAVVSYPVTDLADLAERSHRFERHYTDTLVGPLPAAATTYRDRSPVWCADRFTSTPLLVLHGDADPVVPVEQSRTFAERARAAGAHVELRVYAGEGHGFRQPLNQLDEYARIDDFLARWVPDQ